MREVVGSSPTVSTIKTHAKGAYKTSPACVFFYAKIPQTGIFSLITLFVHSYPFSVGLDFNFHILFLKSNLNATKRIFVLIER